MSDLHIKIPGDKDRRAWSHLYQQYANRYGITLSDTHLDRVWTWLRTPMHPLEAILIQNDLTQTLALVHFHTIANVLSGQIAGVMDDLYVAPENRQHGLGSALIYALTTLGEQRQWAHLSWHCAEDDYIARTLFDQHGKLSPTKLYELDISTPLKPFKSDSAFLQQLEVTSLSDEDKVAWKNLFSDFRKTELAAPLPAETLDIIWSWLINPETLVMGLIIREQTGRAVGLSLFRPFPDPLSGRTAAKIDCFYVAPEAQGTGCADLLLHHTVKEGQARQWVGFQWQIHNQNYRARRFFDKRTTTTDLISYSAMSQIQEVTDFA